ncbi:MAG: host specificity protein [Planctomycetales bacterium]|nr:host specificity protein [Planctomycetales bacterium]
MSTGPRRFKERLAADLLTPLFCLARLPEPLMVEMFGLAGGYAGFWLDQEHDQVSTRQMLAVALAARANQMDCFVRMAPTNYAAVTQCFESGMGGVMAAQISSADQAAEFVSWTKFAPQGTRGMNMSGFDAHYTHRPLHEFVSGANEDGFVAIQIETTGAVDQVDEIAALAGVDLLFVGPVDLSLALGVVGQFHHDKLWEAIGKVAEACRRHGKHWGCVAPDPEFAARAIENGCKMPTVGNDVVAVRRGIAALQGGFSAVFPAD